MIETGKYYAESYYRESDCYRVWIDASGNGSVRILKRVNFKVVVRLLQDLLYELKGKSLQTSHVTFYISRSLREDMSENTIEFINFCKACLDLEFEIVTLD